MPTTGGRSLRYPASSAAPNVAQDIANLANDVDANLPYQWFEIMKSATSYSFAPVGVGVWETLPGSSGSTLVVPTGRSVNVEFRAPSGYADGGYFMVRLLVAGQIVDGNWWTNTRGPSHLSGNVTGAGATIPVSVQAQRLSGLGAIECGNLAPAVLRYQVT